MSEPVLPLPEDAVVLHVGPYKTGSTAIQNTLHQHREDLRAQGILYPGTHHRQARPSWAVVGRGPKGVNAVPMSVWDDLVTEVHESGLPRVVISSEDFASASKDVAARVARDLGPERLHVVIVVRRLDKLLPSAWQERVKSVHETRSYDAWLRDVLSEERTGQAAKTFWFNHGLDSLLGRWGAAVPQERIVLIVSDEDDRDHLLHSFADLLGLPEAALTAAPHENTSLTLDRVELYRRINEMFVASGWPDQVHRRLIYEGVRNGLRAAPPDPVEQRIPRLPPWAVKRVEALHAERARSVRDSRCLVLGDPDRLTAPVDGGDELGDIPDTVAMSTVVAVVEHVMRAAQADLRRAERKHAKQLRQARQAGRLPRQDPAPALDAVGGRHLARELARRVVRRVPGWR